VVKVGDFSTEFCGGTHTHTSAQVGPLLITSESSIGSNLRRVEALTGLSAYEHLVQLRASLDGAGRSLKVGPFEVPARVEALLERLGNLEKELETVRAQRRGELAAELAGEVTKIGEVSLVAATAPDLDATALRQLALGVRDRLSGPSVVVVGAAHGGKGALVGLVSKDLVAAGVSAAEIVGGAAEALGGGGSRDPELSQAGGPRGENLATAIEVARESAGRLLANL
jgi:alanyl-tRNA synthetase